MSDDAGKMLDLLAEMRDLLRLIAEPAIAERDKKFRQAIREIAGAPKGKKAKAILLMDGTRIQKAISKECGIDTGDLSGLVKKLNGSGLLVGDTKQPRIAISIPSNFFENAE